MQAWDGGRGRGEAVTDTPRADLLARQGNAHLVRGGIFGEADIPIDAEDLCRFVSSVEMVLPAAGSHACKGQLTISLTGSSGTVSSISTSRSVSFSTNENQSFSLWRKSGSCTVCFGQSAAMARILRHIVAQCLVECINDSLHGRSVISHCVVVTCDMPVLSVDLDSTHLV